MKSWDKLKSFYLHYRSAYNHQTWQDGNFVWWASAYKVTWPFDEVFLQDHMTNQNLYISTTTVPMATKLRTMVTYLEGSYPLSDILLWSRGLARSHDKPKPLYFYYHSAYDHQTSNNDDLPWRLLPIKWHLALITWSCQITWQLKLLYLYTKVTMANKFDRMITYLDKILPIKLGDSRFEILW